MNKYSNIGGGLGGGYAGYGQHLGAHGQMVDLNDGMDMDEYGEGIEYYDEEDGSSSNSPQQQFYQQQQYQQQLQLAAQAQAQAFAQGNSGGIDSSEGITDSIGISGGAVGLDGFEFMEEELDDDYNPTTEEIEEYARFLGMDIHEDSELFFIAKEGLKAPLPGSWKPCKSPQDTVYYYNFDTKALQKEHPCDDYYRKLYLEERQSRRKKDEEKAIQRQVVQQKKIEKQQQELEYQQVQQQIMQGNFAQVAAAQQPKGAAPVLQAQSDYMNQVAGGTAGSLSQMLGDPLEVSASAVDQLVSYEIENIVEELEEQKIKHERLKREELKYLEQDKRNMKLKFQTDAERDLDELRNRLEMEKQTSSTYTIQQRKVELRSQKDSRIFAARERIHQQLQEKMDSKHKHFDHQVDTHKKDQKDRHEKDQEYVKERFQSKINLQKEKIEDENSALMEQSMDIDQHIALFRKDMINNQIDEQKFKIEDQLRKAMKEQRAANYNHVDEQRQAIQKNFQKKLDDDRDLEHKRNQLNFSSLQDKKEQIRQEMNQKLRDFRRKLDREFEKKVAGLADKVGQYAEDQKDGSKADVSRQYEVKFKRIEEQKAKFKEHRELEVENYELDKEDEFFKQKGEIERKIKNEWLEQKREHESREEDNQHDYQSIIKEIKDSKQKVRKLQQQHDELTRQMKQQEKEHSHLKQQKVQKQDATQKKERDLTNQSNQKIMELEAELEELETKISSLLDMINEKKRQYKQATMNKFSSYQQPKAAVSRASFEPAGQDFESNKKFAQLMNELDQAKLDILALKEQALKQQSLGQAGIPHGKHHGDFSGIQRDIAMEKRADSAAIAQTRATRLAQAKKQYLLAPPPDFYDIVEIKERLTLEQGQIKKRKEQIQDEIILTKQLLKNIQKNRISVTKEYYESDKLSLQRKMAIKSIKDKVDEQAAKITQNEMLITDSWQQVRRQEKLLNQCSALMDQVDAQGADGAEAPASNIVRELQALYDKYLKVYGKKRPAVAYQRSHIDTIIDGDGAEKFEKKWTSLLDEVDQEMDGSEQFKVLHRATAQKQNYIGFSNTNAYRFYGRRRLRYRFN